MRQFKCGDVVPGCGHLFEGESDEEILQHVAEHAREEHGMDAVPGEVADTICALISER